VSFTLKTAHVGLCLFSIKYIGIYAHTVTEDISNQIIKTKTMQLKYHLFIPEIVRGFPKQELACQFSAQRGSSEVAQLLANGRIIIMLATPTYFFWHLRAFLLKRRCAC